MNKNSLLQTNLLINNIEFRQKIDHAVEEIRQMLAKDGLIVYGLSFDYEILTFNNKISVEITVDMYYSTYYALITLNEFATTIWKECKITR